jgi:hypothetical protein
LHFTEKGMLCVRLLLTHSIIRPNSGKSNTVEKNNTPVMFFVLV